MVGSKIVGVHGHDNNFRWLFDKDGPHPLRREEFPVTLAVVIEIFVAFEPAEFCRAPNCTPNRLSNFSGRKTALRDIAASVIRKADRFHDQGGTRLRRS